MMNCFRKGKLSDADILAWLTSLRANAYIPESGFAATAVSRVRMGDADDYYFGGVNVENIDHRTSTHAEEACIAAMVTSMGRHAEIIEGWVMGAAKDAPANSDALASCCGKCRQQLAGFADADVKIHSVALNGHSTTTTVGEFLPDLFTYRKYLSDAAAEKKSVHAPARDEVQHKLIHQTKHTDQQIFDWLKKMQSVDYASKVSQSIVLHLDNSAYVGGTKIEEAAFLSISPAQSALAIAMSEFGPCRVQEAWVYTKGRDGQEVPKGHVGTLTLSALQPLLQCAAHPDIPLYFFADDGNMLRSTLSAAAAIAPTAQQPFHKTS